MRKRAKVIPLAVKYPPGSLEELRYWQAVARAQWRALRRAEAAERRRRCWREGLTWTGAYWGLQWLGAGCLAGLWNPLAVVLHWGLRFTAGAVGIWLAVWGALLWAEWGRWRP
jgi:hypothetical protein